MKSYVIKDEKKRVIFKFQNGHIAIARYPDMTDKCKEYLIGVCLQVTEWEEVKVKDFLNYKSENNEFCS